MKAKLLLLMFFVLGIFTVTFAEDILVSVTVVEFQFSFDKLYFTCNRQHPIDCAVTQYQKNSNIYSYFDGALYISCNSNCNITATIIEPIYKGRVKFTTSETLPFSDIYTSISENTVIYENLLGTLYLKFLVSPPISLLSQSSSIFNIKFVVYQ